MAAPGDFSFLRKDNDTFSKMWVETCRDAYKVCTEENLWPFFKDFSPPENQGYMWWKKDAPHYDEWARVNKILGKIDNGHSGASWGHLMRTLEYIAKNGWDKYVATCTLPT